MKYFEEVHKFLIARFGPSKAHGVVPCSITQGEVHGVPDVVVQGEKYRLYVAVALVLSPPWREKVRQFGRTRPDDTVIAFDHDDVWMLDRELRALNKRLGRHEDEGVESDAAWGQCPHCNQSTVVPVQWDPVEEYEGNSAYRPTVSGGLERGFSMGGCFRCGCRGMSPPTDGSETVTVLNGKIYSHRNMIVHYPIAGSGREWCE